MVVVRVGLGRGDSLRWPACVVRLPSPFELINYNLYGFELAPPIDNFVKPTW